MNNAIDLLIKELERIKAAKTEAISKFNSQISELEASIERLSGKKVWEVSAGSIYDDEHPDYIKASIEE